VGALCAPGRGRRPQKLFRGALHRARPAGAVSLSGRDQEHDDVLPRGAGQHARAHRLSDRLRAPDGRGHLHAPEARRPVPPRRLGQPDLHVLVRADVRGFLPRELQADLRLLPPARRGAGRAPLRFLRRDAGARHDRNGRQHLAGLHDLERHPGAHQKVRREDQLHGRHRQRGRRQARLDARGHRARGPSRL